MGNIRWGKYNPLDGRYHVDLPDKTRIPYERLVPICPVIKERMERGEKGTVRFVARSPEEIERIAQERGATIIAEYTGDVRKLRGFYYLFAEKRSSF